MPVACSDWHTCFKLNLKELVIREGEGHKHEHIANRHQGRLILNCKGNGLRRRYPKVIYVVRSRDMAKRKAKTGNFLLLPPRYYFDNFWLAYAYARKTGKMTDMRGKAWYYNEEGKLSQCCECKRKFLLLACYRDRLCRACYFRRRQLTLKPRYRKATAKQWCLMR